MSEPIKHRDHLWLVSVFGSTEERAKAEMAERGDREGVVVFFFSTGATTSHVHSRFAGVKIIFKMMLNWKFHSFIHFIPAIRLEI